MKSIYVLSRRNKNGALIKKKFTCFLNWPRVAFSFLCIAGNKALGTQQVGVRERPQPNSETEPPDKRYQELGVGLLLFSDR